MPGGRKPSIPKRWLLLGAAMLLVLAVVLPPLINIGRYHRRIAALISRSIGRPVHMSSVSLRLFPMPAVEMPNFVVEEEPGFGAEPVLRSDSVIAYLRLSSLWRGRLEIARIHFDDASVNLVRSPNGAWNFASILVQAAHSSTAPTGQRRPGPAPRFPYIEATNARINFKEGNEKKPFSFLNADLSVWLDNPEQWGVHFKAQPVRTDLDLDLADSGILRVDGTFRRAATLSEMPLALNARWTAAPLGQLSRLVLGRDIGWRGNLDFQAVIRGPAAAAHVKTVMKIASLHRAEFAPPRPLDLETLCEASYHKLSSSFEDIACASQAGGGTLTLTGSVRHMRIAPETSLALEVHNVPASVVIAALQEVRDGFGGGVRAVGDLNGRFQYVSSVDDPPVLAGEMAFDSLKLFPPDSGRPFILAPVRFSFENPPNSDLHNTKPSSKRVFTGPPALLLEPVRLSLGGPVPLTIDGRFTLDGFAMHLSGAAALSRLRAVNRILVPSLPPSVTRVSASSLAPVGSATLDLSVLGPWLLPLADPDAPVPSSVTVGALTVKNAELTASYLAKPLRIISAQAVISPTVVAWTDASIAFGALQAQGTLEYPTACPSGASCPGRFLLSAPALSLADLQSSLLGSGEHGELLRAFLSHMDHHPADWPELSGTVQAGALSVGKLMVHDVAGSVEIAGSTMRIRSLSGRLLKGALHLTGMLDASGSEPSYDLTVQVANASPGQFADLFEEHWGSGSAGFSAHLKMAGFTARDLAESTTGTVHWDWKNGDLTGPNPMADAPEPLLPFGDWRGDATIENSTIKTTHSLMIRGEDTMPVTGTISFNRELDLKCGSTGETFSVAGNFEHPRVKAPTRETASHAAP